MLQKKVLIKFGSKCNLKCAHCHCYKVEYSFNLDILNYIRDSKFNIIVFGGGEPLMYFDLIKKIVLNLNDPCIEYRFVTNGFFLTPDNIAFFNEHNFRVAISYDGRAGNRGGCPESLKYIKHLKNHVLATTVYEDNIDLSQLFADVQRLSEEYGTVPQSFPNFIHQTQINPNYDMVNEDTATKYIKQICTLLETDIRRIALGHKQNIGAVIKKLPEIFKQNNWKIGVSCCNENKIMLTADGRFMLCPYGNTYVGDIYTGVDWNLVESFIPERCKSCDLWSVCGNTCVENITENECYIFKNIYRHYLKLLDKYKLTKENIENISW